MNILLRYCKNTRIKRGQVCDVVALHMGRPPSPCLSPRLATLSRFLCASQASSLSISLTISFVFFCHSFWTFMHICKGAIFCFFLAFSACGASSLILWVLGSFIPIDCTSLDFYQWCHGVLSLSRYFKLGTCRLLTLSECLVRWRGVLGSNTIQVMIHQPTKQCAKSKERFPKW